MKQKAKLTKEQKRELQLLEYREGVISILRKAIRQMKRGQAEPVEYGEEVSAPYDVTYFVVRWMVGTTRKTERK